MKTIEFIVWLFGLTCVMIAAKHSCSHGLHWENFLTAIIGTAILFYSSWYAYNEENNTKEVKKK